MHIILIFIMIGGAFWLMDRIQRYHRNRNFLLGLQMLYPNVHPDEIKKYARDVYGRG
jgi:hypothetical protein